MSGFDGLTQLPTIASGYACQAWRAINEQAAAPPAVEEKFEEIKEKMEELEKQNEELSPPKDLGDDNEEQMEDIQEETEESNRLPKEEPPRRIFLSAAVLGVKVLFSFIQL